MSDASRGGTALLAVPPTLTDTGWSAPLRIPEEHPFFFDHALDHVPGMLFICALLDLIAAAMAEQSDDGGRRLTAELAFPHMCDLKRPIMLSVIRDGEPANRYVLRATQDARTGCDGWLRFVNDTECAGAGDEYHDLRPGQCPAELVNRSRLGNVLLGQPIGRETIIAPLVRPPAGHYLAGFGDRGYSVRGIIEASRQFCTLLVHHAAQKSLDTKLIWLRVAIDLPCAPPGVVSALRWRRERLAGNRFTFTAELVGGHGGPVIGTVTSSVATISPAGYQRFRLTAAASRDRA